MVLGGFIFIDLRIIWTQRAANSTIAVQHGSQGRAVKRTMGVHSHGSIPYFNSGKRTRIGKVRVPLILMMMTDVTGDGDEEI